MNNLNPIIHIIRPGDTLYNLAAMYGTTIQEIINTNLAIDPYNLRVGQKLYIYPNNSYNNTISINHSNLLEYMNLVWLEHVLWTRMLLISIAENLNDLEPTKERLLKNPRDIANIFRKYYGNNIANIIENLLTEHLKIGADLITALKNKDQQLAQELNTKWYKNADDMASAFSRINPFYKEDEIKHMLYNHLKFTTNQVSNSLNKSYQKDIKSYDMVLKEALQMAIFFVNGTIEQFPNLLKKIEDI